MPRRKDPLITSHYYHVFNRGNNRQKIFITGQDYSRAKTTIDYYQYSMLPIKLSHFLAKSRQDQVELTKQRGSLNLNVEVVAYCLMPNHFHFLLKQSIDNGVSVTMANFQNSYTKYFNAKHKRQGSLLQRQFKAVPIESQGQFFHLTRYIMLNPYSSQLVKNPEMVLEYPYSFINYHLFEKVTGSKKEQFFNSVQDQADYQKNLELIKHLTLDENWLPG